MATHPLLPDPQCLMLDSLRVENGVILFAVRITRRAVACPQCGYSSGRVHSRYRRTLTDLPWQGNAVRIQMTARKFFCDNKACSQRIFTEPMPVVAARYGRKTARLADALQELTLLTGGEAAARIAKAFGLVLSPDALLEAVHKSSSASVPTPRVLGMDDFAFRRGRVYGTILVDLERRCPVDLLPDREAATVAKWLSDHPGVQIISRDRGHCYREGATQGAPNALQVADRWHLLKNLGDTLEIILRRHHRQIREAAHQVAKTAQTVAERRPSEPPDSSTRSEREKEQTRVRREACFEQVQELYRTGCSQRDIQRKTGLDTKTIRKYLKASICPSIAKRRPRPTALTPFHSYIKRRWEEGCHNAAVILREITAQGYRGKGTALRDFVQPFRAGPRLRSRSPDRPAVVVREAIPAPSVVRWWFLGHVTTKDADQEAWQREFLGALRTLCPEMGVVQELAVSFGQLVKERMVEVLDGWLERAKQCGVSEIRGFAKGLIQDGAAVRAALSQEWSNGQVEGQVNRLKFLKRSMYGRAGFDLLRARVLHRAAA